MELCFVGPVLCLDMLLVHSKCGPRLSAAASEKLKNRYVLMRTGAREHERESDKRPSIPITVRYVELRDMYLAEEHHDCIQICQEQLKTTVIHPSSISQHFLINTPGMDFRLNLLT